MTEIVKFTGLTLLEQIKSNDELTDELLTSLYNVFQPNTIVEAGKLIDENKVKLLQSPSGRQIFKV